MLTYIIVIFLSYRHHICTTLCIQGKKGARRVLTEGKSASPQLPPPLTTPTITQRSLAESFMCSGPPLSPCTVKLLRLIQRGKLYLFISRIDYATLYIPYLKNSNFSKTLFEAQNHRNSYYIWKISSLMLYILHC